MNRIFTVLSLFVLFFISCFSLSAQTMYVCQGDVYKTNSVTLTSEVVFHNSQLQIGTKSYELAEIDSITFARPARSLKLDFTDFIADNHTVEAIFVMGNGGKDVCTNTAMKNSGASTVTTSDVEIITNPVVSAEKPVFQYNISKTTAFTNGFSITVQYDGGRLLTINSSASYPTTTFNRVINVNEGDARKNNWMATIPSKVLVNMLTIPGAHDAATRKCSGASQCQSLTIPDLLNAGVRALDLRPRYNASNESDITLDNLEIYHGVSATGVKFKDAIADVAKFLTENPTEMVFINMQKENASGRTDYSSTWRTSVRTCLKNYSSQVVQKLTTTLTLGDCRGKMLVVSHNPYGSEGVYNDIVYGALASSWSDDATFDTDLLYTNGTKVTTAHVSDNYNATKESDKQGYVSAILTSASSSTKDWYYCFVNVAYKFLGNNPVYYAKLHNKWLNGMLQNSQWKSRLGVLFYDFCGDESCTPALLQSLIQQNYRYIY